MGSVTIKAWLPSVRKCVPRTETMLTLQPQAPYTVAYPFKSSGILIEVGISSHSSWESLEKEFGKPGFRRGREGKLRHGTVSSFCRAALERIKEMDE